MSKLREFSQEKHVDSQRLRLGVDIGGTFTDMVLVGPSGGFDRIKIPSSPPAYAIAVIDGLKSLIDRSTATPAAIEYVAHGMTVATNAVLEHRGAKTGLITTRRFRDVLELGRMRHPEPYDIFWEKPAPLVPRRYRMEVDERITSLGAIEKPICRKDVVEVVERFVSHGVESVAVCLLNSYINSEHEEIVADIIRSDYPELALSVSSEILPEIKEYERMSTTVVNAYVQPIVGNYIGDLARQLTELPISTPLHIMKSSGGLAEEGDARANPVQLIESGPAAGVIAARALAEQLHLRNVISFDMGGTTAKASLIENGQPVIAAENEVGGTMNTRRGLIKGGGYPIRAPSIDLVEVGAGGGSIFWIDDEGVPHVGPQSAGAIPGPACYGRGGQVPTLTDAAVVLGYINPGAIAGGAQVIDRALALDVITRDAATPLEVDVHDAALGLIRIAISNMSKAIRAVTIERGRDPRAFHLIAFGGAGPLVAADLAREFGIESVIVPPQPGLFSAVGLLLADIQYDHVISIRDRDGLEPAVIERSFVVLEQRLRSRLSDDDHRHGEPIVERFADVRYAGQSSELRLSIPPGRVDDEALAELRSRFDEEHHRTYGHSGVEHRIEIVNVRVRVVLPLGRTCEHFGQTSGPESRITASRRRHAYFGEGYGFVETRVLDRNELQSTPLPGPFIVEDMDATTVIPPNAEASRDQQGNIIVHLAQTPSPPAG